MTKRTAGIVAATAAVLITVVLAYQEANATRYEARRAAWSSAKALAANGFNFNDAQVGYIGYRRYTVVPMHLYSGIEYAFVSSGCRDAHDIDLAIYDSQGRLIKYDTSSDKHAIISFSPRYTGRYYAQVFMRDSTADGAHYSLTAGTR